MFFNVVILKFILMITAPYVFQRCDFDLIGDDCKKPIVAKNPLGFFAIKKIVAKNPLQKTQGGFFATEINEVGFLQRFSNRDPNRARIPKAFWAKKHHRASTWSKFGPKTACILLYVGAVRPATHQPNGICRSTNSKGRK